MQRLCHNYFLFALLFISVLCLSLFLALYITAYAVTGDAADTTLSEMLSENETVQQLYLVFIGSYALITFNIIFLIWVYNSSDVLHESTEYKSCCARHRITLYDVVSYGYVISSVIKLVGFIGLFWFDCNTQSQGHYVFATLGFVFAYISMWLLFFRRIILHFNEWNIHAEGKQPFSVWFLAFDFVYLLTGTSFLISFAAVRNGILEFLSSLWIVLDQFFLVWDFIRFKSFQIKHATIDASVKPTVQYILPSRQSYPLKIYHTLLYYYNNRSV